MQGRSIGAGINGEARLMKSPLRYQISDYDCGPTSMLNAVSFLFEREQIPPELIRNIMLFSLEHSARTAPLAKAAPPARQ